MQEIEINGKIFNVGDTVEILKVTDDSGRAVDIYGVEAHLDGWIDDVYIEDFKGEIVFDTDLLMYVIKGKYKSIPLSSTIRYDLWNGLYDRLKVEDLLNIKNEFALENTEYETIINHIKIIKKIAR